MIPASGTLRSECRGAVIGGHDPTEACFAAMALRCFEARLRPISSDTISRRSADLLTVLTSLSIRRRPWLPPLYPEPPKRPDFGALPR